MEKTFELPTSKKAKGITTKSPHERMAEHAASADAIVANHKRMVEETKEIYVQDATRKLDIPEPEPSVEEPVQLVSQGQTPATPTTPYQSKTLHEKLEAQGDQADAIVAKHKEYQEEAKEQFTKEGARAAQRVQHEKTLSETAIKTSIEVTSVVNRQIAAINLKVSGYRFKANYRILIEWAAEKMMSMPEEEIYRELLPYYRRQKK